MRIHIAPPPSNFHHIPSVWMNAGCKQVSKLPTFTVALDASVTLTTHNAVCSAAQMQASMMLLLPSRTRKSAEAGIDIDHLI